MNTSFKTIKYSDDLIKAYNLIYSEKMPVLPVVNQDKLVGVIDATNLNEYMLLQAKLAH